jgi:DNA polymerase-1
MNSILQPFPQIKIINGTDEIKSLIQKARISPRVAIYFIADHKDFLNPEIIAFGIALDENEGFGISVEQSGTDVLKDFFDMAVTGQDVLICHNFKELHRIFSNHGFDIHSCSLDTMLASYLLNPQREKHGMENMMLEYLGLKFDMMKDAKSAAACASILIRLASLIREKIEKNRLDFLLHDVEIPLSAVLSRMEKTGIRCDSLKLLEISSQISKRILELEKDIYFHAGTHFNISSPKQLSDILFTKMRLTSSRKTKTGFSTDQSVLEEISDQHLIVDLILEHRSLMKLKTTYTDVLPELIHPATKRIHTSFNQVVTATGRLSSSDPNLQNIPIRTEIGKSIREAFIADEGHVLLSADYSQIELRILAYLSSDERLIETFMNNEDIHQRTACEIFNVNPQSVTPDMRRAAKVVNFGILYGMSAFRLSRDLKISTHDAKNFMEKYFSRYPGVRKFIDDTIESARDRGYVSTILNRIRYIPDINSSNKNVRGFAERTAVNTPVQGSAADIIKLAMINVQKEIDQKNLKTKMVLQVHDELVFVVPEKELDIFKAAVRNRMENVMENISLKLKVPLVVDIGIGRNWSQAHG